jgi:hypothetical protein
MRTTYLKVDISWTEVIEVRRVVTFLRLLDRFAEPAGRSLVDLGAGHCNFARWARDRGYRVTAVDARADRVPAPDTLGSIRFVCSDVRDFCVSGFDVILVLGLLYHLTLEDQVALLRRCATGAVLIVDTQVHYPHLVPENSGSWQTVLARRDAYEGVIYPENDNTMAGFGNSQSFWHTEPSLLRLFAHCGFADAVVIDPIYVSKYGGRRFFVLKGSVGLAGERDAGDDGVAHRAHRPPLGGDEHAGT